MQERDDAASATTLYRLYDDDDRLLYVGITWRDLQRLSEHSKDKGWWRSVARATFEHFATRADACAAELRAIRTEEPLFNVVGAKYLKPADRPVTINHPLPYETAGRLPRVVDDDEMEETFNRHCRRNFKMSADDLIQAIRRGEIKRNDPTLRSIANFMRDDWFVPR